MSFPRYPEYKDSGVEWLGAVPKQWQVKRIRHVAQLNPSKTEIKQLDPEMLVSFLPMEAVGDAGSLNLERETTIAEVQSGYTYFREGDVTYAKITPCFENGKGAHMRGLLNGIGFGSTELVAVRPDYSQTTSDYLNWIFCSPVFRRLAEASMYGAGGQKRVPDDFTRDFALGFPHIEEQVLISRFLFIETAKLDNLMAEQEKLIALLKEKRQAVIAHAVTKGLNPTVPMRESGVEWLGEVPAHWEVSQLKYVARDGTSITYGIVQAGPHVEGGIPYIKTSDMSGESLPLEGYSRTSSEIDQSYSRSKVFFGDLVIAIRASVGKCLSLPEELDGANLTQGTAKISPGEGVERDYLLNLINSAGLQVYFDSMAKGATFKEITLDMLRRTPVLIPPLAEQRDIARYLATELKSFQNLLQETEKAISLLKERRTALISAAVTGQIDVRGLIKEEQEQAA